MLTSTRIARALLATCALALGGCTSILGDFVYDPNGTSQGGSGGGGTSGGEQGDIVVMPPSGLITTEQGAKATFTIALKVKPTDTVTIALQSSNEAEGKVSPKSVEFNSENFAAPQTVQVTGVDDPQEDGAQTYNILTSPAFSKDAHYSGLNPLDPELKNIDDESAGFLVTPTTGLVTNESGGEATFTVVLTRAPTAAVTIPLSSDNSTEGSVSPVSLLFTPENWMAPQVVTVTGLNDDVADKEVTYHVVTAAAASDDTDYAPLNPDDVTVVNQDNDTAGIMLTPGTGLVTFENGTMTTFGIALSSPPTKDVTIQLSSSDPGEGTVTPEQVVFTPENWMAPQIVTITGQDDEGADGNQPYLIQTAPAVSDDIGYADKDGPDAEVINIDDENPGLVVSPSAGLITSEVGGSATFSVMLTSQPRGDVLLDVESSRTTEGEVTPALLTFTALNWNAPQMVTVTGVDDAVADGMQQYTVHVRPKPESGDADYATKVLETDVGLSNTDDDSAGITVMAGSGLETTEGGDQATFSIALNSEPKAQVTIELTSSDTSEGAVSPAKLVFTPDNYKAPQVVTVSGVNDDMADGSQPYRVITAPAVSDDPGYNGVDASNVDLKNTDDDSAGITIKPANQTLTTNEDGATASFTVVLNSQPRTGNDVTIDVSSSNIKEGTVNVSSLRFTGDNWRAPQTVTVKGVDDDHTADGAQQYRVVLGKAQSNDANYSVIDPPDVKCSNTDNDSAGITLKNTSGLTTKEAGGSASFTMVLNSKPTADVTIGLSSSNTKEGTVSPASLKFTSANWSAPQTVTVKGVNDPVADGNQVYRVVTAAATSNDTGYAGMNPSNASVTNIDDDSPGVIVNFSPAAGLSTKEDGLTASFTVQLQSQPTADVSIPVRSSNTKEGTVSPATLSFTTANWNSPHTVTVTGVDDKVQDGPQPYSVIVDASTSNDPLYKGLNGRDVPATNVDDDSAGLTVSAASGDTSEDLTTASFTIKLNSEPKANVTFALTSSRPKEGQVSQSSVTFTPQNWNGAQKITVTGVNDAVDDGKQPYNVAVGPGDSSDLNYKGKFATEVPFNNVDNDSAGILVSALKGSTSEFGDTATFTIRLGSQPTADVTIPVSSSNKNEGTLAVTQVTFTPSSYASAVTITITGVDDDAADGPQQYSIVVGAATSPDTNYASLDVDDVPVTNTDNDSAGLIVKPLTGQTGEKPSAKAFTFTVALTSKPSANVTIPISSSDATEGTVSPTTLTFDSTNWKGAQTVTVTGVNDASQDGDQDYKILFGAATSSDKSYSGLDDPAEIALKNIDDDQAGFDVSPPAGSTTEKGATTTFTIALRSQPTSSVTIALTSSDTTEGTLDAANKSVTFTTDNWNSPQTVTIHGENDSADDGSILYTIKTGLAMSSDPGYNGKDAEDVDIVNIDDDTAGIAVSPASGHTSEGGGTATFTVVLNSQPTASVSIPIASSDTDEGALSKATVDFTTGNWSVAQTITVTGVNDDVADGDQDYKIVLSKPTSGDAAYAQLDLDAVPMVNNDNDNVGFEVSSVSNDISESGSSATFKISLRSQPKANVIIPLSVSDDTEAKLPVKTVMFTSDDWKTPKPITVIGVDDDAVDGLQNTKVLTGLTESDDPGYEGKDPKDVDITTLDDDSAFISVSPPVSSTNNTALSRTGEAASADTIKFSVVLTSMPSATVTIPVASLSETEGTVTSPASGVLTFTSSNWDKLQWVTVSGVDDATADGDVMYSIQLGPSVSKDSGYDDKTPAAVMLTNVDDD